MDTGCGEGGREREGEREGCETWKLGVCACVFVCVCACVFVCACVCV